MNVKFDMTARLKVVFGCLQAAHAQNFLLFILIDRLGQHSFIPFVFDTFCFLALEIMNLLRGSPKIYA